jgi:hypothetical protein
MKTRPFRSLKDVLARGSAVSEVENPHRRYLRVANLELRRTLCRKVRDAALKRAEEMQTQIAQIEGEASQLLAGGMAADGGARRPPPTVAARRCPGGARRPTLQGRPTPQAEPAPQASQPRTVTLKY